VGWGVSEGGESLNGGVGREGGGEGGERFVKGELVEGSWQRGVEAVRQ